MKLLSREKKILINSLIPAAEKEASMHIRRANTKVSKRNDVWSAVFHRTMDTLCKRAGVRV